ncbi:NADAR family protein [Kordiimonas sp. SCSIO 12610]|uniref:NADAR family protein n=1 Tax=Kordiimonas sp. SCSIO 12610 TaxID=2829597 RepID=UPI002109DAAB|nr:NADAR family protein [Kordiimonas sp. SCSIO 12610]UTW56640.1 NADAR family protein [Kordiimonas sp. SCSIO 12610]
MNTIDNLIAAAKTGERLKYVFFWSHKDPSGTVSKACFSQWYPRGGVEGDYSYLTAEHYMMAEKARLFGDQRKFDEIIDAENPGKAKALGREVLSFDQAIWNKHKFDVAVRGNYIKFSQNSDLKEFLLNTGKRVLVEASPVDPIWGIGMSVDDPEVENPEKWKGQNLLGFALMEVREMLRR